MDWLENYEHFFRGESENWLSITEKTKTMSIETSRYCKMLLLQTAFKLAFYSKRPRPGLGLSNRPSRYCAIASMQIKAPYRSGHKIRECVSNEKLSYGVTCASPCYMIAFVNYHTSSISICICLNKHLIIVNKTGFYLKVFTLVYKPRIFFSPYPSTAAPT